MKEAGVACNISFISAVGERKTRSYFCFNNGKRKCMQVKAKKAECLTFLHKRKQATFTLDVTFKL
jgi:IS30 family transposase